MKGDLYAQGKSSHELQEVIGYMGKAPPAIFILCTALPPDSMTVNQSLSYQLEADSWVFPISQLYTIPCLCP